MAVLFVLFGGFLLATLGLRLAGKTDCLSAGRIGLAAMLLFTALGHVLFTEGMALMIPDFLPFRKEAVYLTGVLEVAAAVGLLLPRWYKTTGWLLIVFFVLLLPANISAALRHVNYETATFDGPGPAYLWYRVPEQLLFIGWTYFFAVRKRGNKMPDGQTV